MGYVDAHVHVWTADFDRYPLAEGYTPAQMQPPTFTPEELLAHCRPLGVDRIVLVQMSFYGTDNRYMLDTMSRYPGVFGGIAVIDPAGPAVEAEMDRLGELGVRGFRIQPAARPAAEWLTPGHERMFAHAQRTGQALCCLINPEALPDLERLARCYPQAPVVIDHLCRIGAGGVILAEDVAALCRLAVYPQIKVKVSAFYALGSGRPPYHDLLPLLREVYAAYGPQRLMWATDCPYQVQQATYEDSLALVRDAFVEADAKARQWLLEKTAAETFLGA